MNRVLRLFGLLLGVGVLSWLIAHADPNTLVGVFPRIGWGFLAILAVRAATIPMNAAAWRFLIPPSDRPPFASLTMFRWIGEAINATLLVWQIGGDVVRARLLQQRISAPARGAASVAARSRGAA